MSRNNRLESDLESTIKQTLVALLNGARARLQAFLTGIPESSVADTRDVRRFL
jgi:hypothetical protein